MDIDTQSAIRPRALHQYACIHCRQRRVKCDKILSGCANCMRKAVQCVYTARRPRKTQKAYPEAAIPRPLLPVPQKADNLGNELIFDHPTPPPVDLSNDQGSEEDDEEEDAIIPRDLRNQPYGTCKTGRLTIRAGGKSYYINHDKHNQVSYFETVLASDTVENIQASSIERSISHQQDPSASSLLAVPVAQANLRSYYPPLTVIPQLWDYYTQYVDNMFKLVYKPNVARLIHDASSGSHVDASAEALLFAIWYAAIASTPSDTCQSLFGTRKKPLLQKYRILLEQALVQAGWMTTQELIVLQGLAIYLVFASQNSRSTWMICGISISLAQSMGLHMESDSFPLTTIDTEVRRRVWWSLCQIDVRVSENCGLEPHVPFIMNTQLPLHINDADLEVDFPVQNILPRNEKTEMTLTLIKLEMAQANLRFKRAQWGPSLCIDEERDSVIKKQLQRYQEVYLKYFDDDSEFSRLCSLGIRLVMTRLWKLMYDASRPQEPAGIGELDERLLSYNADVLEISHQLPDRYRQFGWFFRCKYTQWHALTYLLIQLCKHTYGTAVDRAWDIIDGVMGDLEQNGSPTAPAFINVTIAHKKNSLWQPLLRLLAKARASRAQATQCVKKATDTQSTLKSGSNTTTTTPNPQLVDPWPVGKLTNHDQEGIIGDAVLGPSLDFGEEMNWEHIDTWVNDFQSGLAQEDGMMYGEKSTLGALDWW